MIRPRHRDWLPSRAEVEEMIAEQAQFEEDALTQGRLSLFALCQLRFLPSGPGLIDPPLMTGATIAPSGRPFRRRGGHDGTP